MIKRLVVTGSLLVALLPGAALATSVNQGDESKVINVDNYDVWCENPVPGGKVEDVTERWIYGTTTDPIDKVTVKSGQDAEVIYRAFSDYSFFIKLSKDVSNYVIWTCPSVEYPNQDQ